MVCLETNSGENHKMPNWIAATVFKALTGYRQKWKCINIKATPT
jgi:hypothetical protein